MSYLSALFPVMCNRDPMFVFRYEIVFYDHHEEDQHISIRYGLSELCILAKIRFFAVVISKVSLSFSVMSFNCENEITKNNDNRITNCLIGRPFLTKKKYKKERGLFIFFLEKNGNSCQETKDFGVHPKNSQGHLVVVDTARQYENNFETFTDL